MITTSSIYFTEESQNAYTSSAILKYEDLETLMLTES